MQNHFPPWGTISIMPPAQWGSGFQPVRATLTIPTMNYLNPWGNQNLKNLLFCLLNLALKSGPKNVSGFLQAIWKSIFISSHRTPFANASLARGTPCSSQSLQWRALPNWQRMACEQLAPISLPRKVIVMGPESMALERRVLAQQDARGHSLLGHTVLLHLTSELLPLPFLKRERQLHKYSCSCNTLKCERSRDSKIMKSLFWHALYQTQSQPPFNDSPPSVAVAIIWTAWFLLIFASFI